MAAHDAPVVLLAQLDSVDGLGDGADLVDLQQERVAGLLLDGGLDASHVGHLVGGAGMLFGRRNPWASWKERPRPG